MMFNEIEQPKTEGLVGMLILAFVIAFPIAIILLVVAKPDPAAARVLAEHGYTNIKITGYRWSGCNQGDIGGTGYIADAPVTHITVTGEVCTSIAGPHMIKED